MIIPHEQLEPDTLRALVEEFVTRDGTDHTDVEPRVERILEQLRIGDLAVTFDRELGTTHILRRDDIAGASDDEMS